MSRCAPHSLPFPCVPDRPYKILLLQVGTLSSSHPSIGLSFLFLSFGVTGSAAKSKTAKALKKDFTKTTLSHSRQARHRCGLARASTNQRKQTTQGRDGRRARRHHTGILKERSVVLLPPSGVYLFLSLACSLSPILGCDLYASSLLAVFSLSTLVRCLV